CAMSARWYLFSGAPCQLLHFNVDIIIHTWHVEQAFARVAPLTNALTARTLREVPMATEATITPARANEDVSVYIPTLISKLFSTLLGTLAVAIEADRDIEHVDVFDPAFDGWLKDAERAWDKVIDLR